MSSRTVRFAFQPLDRWPYPHTVERRSPGTFRASWDDTVGLLRDEVWQLGGALVVVQVVIDAGRIRQDGMLHATASPLHPGVRVSFDSRHGPLAYASDRFDGWRANVRAIALSLQALRAVDRYGVTGRGEQYQGWTAISNRPAEMTVDVAAGLIATWAGDGFKPEGIIGDRNTRRRAYRAAAQATHPDRTRDEDTFARINQAHDLLNRMRPV